MGIDQVFAKTPSLMRALEECRRCSRDVYARAQDIVKTSTATPREFQVSCGGIPLGMLTVQRNLFSSFFHATYELLEIPQERRHLYGRINYLFRIWVTSADNLLDDEDKTVLDVHLPGDARVMRQVVSIMAADRILHDILDDAVAGHVLSAEEARTLSRATLEVLLPSAAEEASEEEGVTKRPDPKYVLKTIHRLKTALLFHLPLLGPERIEKGIDQGRLALCRDGLSDFGIGCQILDDVRDMARDHLERRHNYILSVVERDKPSLLRLRSLEKKLDVDQKIFPEFPEACAEAVRLADTYLRAGLARLDACGLGLGSKNIDGVVRFMFKALDVEEARRWLKA